MAETNEERKIKTKETRGGGEQKTNAFDERSKMKLCREREGVAKAGLRALTQAST